VQVCINDNGLGMPKEVQQRIFDPFFTTKPVGKGTGMGMSISYQIICEKHRGLIWCESTPDKGTTFWLQIPIQQAVKLSHPVTEAA
jgi:signal transduction histidine kinase